MADPKFALATQLANIEKRCGRSLAELAALAAASGLERHSELRDHFKNSLGLGLGHGEANTLTHHLRAAAPPDGQSAPPVGAAAEPPGDAALLDALCPGAKAALRPLHEALVREISAFGPFDTAPKKGYVSLRRKRQFAMLGPATQTRFELGLNMKGVTPTDRLLASRPAGCARTLSSSARPTGSIRNWSAGCASPTTAPAEGSGARVAAHRHGRRPPTTAHRSPGIPPWHCPTPPPVRSSSCALSAPTCRRTAPARCSRAGSSS